MNQKTFLNILGVIFATKAIFAIFYLVSGWDAIVGPWVLPQWLMIVAAVVDGYFAYLAFKITKVIK